MGVGHSHPPHDAPSWQPTARIERSLWIAVATWAVLAIVGVVFSAVTAFRFLGGRITDREIVSAHAMYWYFLSVAFVALWFVVYVTK